MTHRDLSTSVGKPVHCLTLGHLSTPVRKPVHCLTLGPRSLVDKKGQTGAIGCLLTPVCSSKQTANPKKHPKCTLTCTNTCLLTPSRQAADTLSAAVPPCKGDSRQPTTDSRQPDSRTGVVSTHA